MALRSAKPEPWSRWLLQPATQPVEHTTIIQLDNREIARAVTAEQFSMRRRGNAMPWQTDGFG